MYKDKLHEHVKSFKLEAEFQIYTYVYFFLIGYIYVYQILSGSLEYL